MYPVPAGDQQDRQQHKETEPQAASRRTPAVCSAVRKSAHPQCPGVSARFRRLSSIPQLYRGTTRFLVVRHLASLPLSYAVLRKAQECRGSRLTSDQPCGAKTRDCDRHNLPRPDCARRGSWGAGPNRHPVHRDGADVTSGIRCNHSATLPAAMVSANRRNSFGPASRSVWQIVRAREQTTRARV